MYNHRMVPGAQHTDQPQSLKVVVRGYILDLEDFRVIIRKVLPWTIVSNACAESKYIKKNSYVDFVK